MYRSVAPAALFAVVCLSAWASEPGQPLSSEDWVMVLPGLTVQQVAPWGTSCQNNNLICGTAVVPYSDHMGADGAFYWVKNDGRQSSGGVLRGRDPAVLPACE